MTSVLQATWFYWAVGVAIGLPTSLVLLTEVRAALVRRGSAYARPVGLLRNFILPLAATVVLLVKTTEVSAEATPVRILSTALGFVVLVLVLSGLSASLFKGAPEGSWRQRIPSIFLDVARFLVIAFGLAVIFSVVWGADVGGLFTALGISSIVLGLALQKSFGQIVSGLFLLFEQPFQIGDFLDAKSGSGRVVEVNWRATHLDTGKGLFVIPNSVLADAPFSNLSRPAGDHAITVVAEFHPGDAPEEVCAMLIKTASGLPYLPPGEMPKCKVAGAGVYRTQIPLSSPRDASKAQATFLRWIWYAARRAKLRLDGLEDDYYKKPRRLDNALQMIAPTLQLNHVDVGRLRQHVRLHRYGDGEVIQLPGEVPNQMTFIVRGQVQLAARAPDGTMITVRLLDPGDFTGSTALTREPVAAAAYAVDEVTVLIVGRKHMEELVKRKPALLQDIGRYIEERQVQVRRALTAAPE